MSKTKTNNEVSLLSNKTNNSYTPFVPLHWSILFYHENFDVVLKIKNKENRRIEVGRNERASTD